MADIFISYSSQDRERARKLAEDLTGLGYSVWLDVCDIDPATRWSTEIAEAINACNILLLLLSRASLASENVLKEVSLAGEKKKHILPVILEKAPLSPDFEYHLAGLQHTAIENLESITRALEHLIETRKTIEQHETPPPGPATEQKRLAVLPFEDLSPGKDNDWFSDGLTEELISSLSKLSGLFVVDRITTRQYKNTRLTLKQIAKELSTQYLLTGTVRKSDHRIQINVTLIDSASGRTVWEHKYPGTMDDIFGIQEQVAFSVAESLVVLLTPKEQHDVLKRRTRNTDAYELGLRANAYIARNTKQDYLSAITLYEQAIKFDPEFAWAYANLAKTFLNIYHTYDRNPAWLEKAEHAVQRAIELDPSDSSSHYSLAVLHLRRGNGDDAVKEALKAIELSPKDSIAYFQLGFIYDGLHEYKKAAAAYERSIALAPFDLDTHYNLILDFDLLGDVEQRRTISERALPYYERYINSNPDDQNKRQKYASLLYFVGRKDDCFREIEALLNQTSLDAKTYFNCACRYAVDGQTDRAFELLIKSLEAGYEDYEHIRTDPDLASLRPTEQWQWLMNHLEQQQRMRTFRSAVTS